MNTSHLNQNINNMQTQLIMRSIIEFKYNSLYEPRDNERIIKSERFELKSHKKGQTLLGAILF